MATTIRTIEYPDGEIFISAYDGTDGIAILRASGGHHSVSFELNRTEVQQLISALQAVAETLPFEADSAEGIADQVWAVYGPQEKTLNAIREYRIATNASLADAKAAIKAARARAEVKS